MTRGAARMRAFGRAAGGGVASPHSPIDVSTFTEAELRAAVEAAANAAGQWPAGGVWKVVAENLLNAVVGIVAGGLVLAGVTLVQRLRGKSTA